MTRQLVTDYFKKYRGREPSEGEFKIYLTANEDDLVNDLVNDPKNVLGQGNKEPVASSDGGGDNLGAAKERVKELYRQKFGYNPNNDSFIEDEAKKWLDRGANMQADQTLITAFNENPGAYTEQNPPGYDDWLKTTGSPYAGQMTDEYINAEFDPYYQKLKGAQEYDKNVAQTELTKSLGREDYLKTEAEKTRELNLKRAATGYKQNVEQTTKNLGTGFNEQGLYGSGIYQQESQRQLGELLKGYEEYKTDEQRAYELEYGADPNSAYSQRKGNLQNTFNLNYGAGEYTPYNMRIADIEQQRKLAKEGAKLSRGSQSWNIYQQQFMPGGAYAQ